MNPKPKKSERSLNSMKERRLFRQLVSLAQAFVIADGHVVPASEGKPSGDGETNQELFASRFCRLLALAAELLPEMSHQHFARYLPGLTALGAISRPMAYGSGELRLRTTSREALSRLKGAQKEPWTVAWIEESVGEGDVFYDIGANLGGYALIAARTGGESCRVYAFEPSFANYAELVHNALLNGLSDRLTAFPVVLTDRSSLVGFQYLGLGPGSAQHGVDTQPIAGAERKPVEPVMVQQIPGFALDHFREIFEIPPPNHVKIDVDGHELSVLAGALRTLASPGLRSVMIETEGEATLEKCAGLLGQAGLTQTDRWDKPAVSYSLFRRP